MSHQCPTCGRRNAIVNQCGCDPNNLPTPVIPELPINWDDCTKEQLEWLSANGAKRNRDDADKCLLDLAEAYAPFAAEIASGERCGWCAHKFDPKDPNDVKTGGMGPPAICESCFDSYDRGE